MERTSETLFKPAQAAQQEMTTPNDSKNIWITLIETSQQTVQRLSIMQNNCTFNLYLKKIFQRATFFFIVHYFPN